MLEAEKHTGINLKGWIAFTITNYNVLHLPEFMKWKLEQSNLTKFNPITGMRPIITEHLCHNPKYYNIKVLPKYIKKQITDRNINYIEWVKSTNYSDHVKTKFAKILQGVNRFMNSEDFDGKILEIFIEETKKLDKIRGQNILDIVPQYKEMFDAYNK